ncbi:MAG TPA: adenylate/guanylate cyclase domain-containing protein [Candidatus Limnocylindria bacterium]|nr:adenylate/guanylate cyclase domain-containing protein [Candidatus Limnocylindria bacterium]
MTCPVCDATNPEAARFCLNCGARLGCPTCSAPIVPGAKFCANCGTRLIADDGGAIEPTPTVGSTTATRPGAGAAGSSGASSAAAPRTTERRVVNVLFADLVGFTTLSATRDPETIRDLQSRYFERTREIIGRYGGVVEKFIGDAVMAVWGAPTAFEDDAERAVRAALDLVEMVPLLGTEIGIELQLRAGVLTGEAAVEVGAEGEGMVAGDMVNTAARLQSAAAPGTVLVGEATRLAAGEAIAFEFAGDQELKGKPVPVPAWRALRVVAERGGARRPDAIEPPFVGRAEELRFLKEQFHATGREGRARLVSLVGQAGIGKSRLAWELEKYLDGVVDSVWWHRGRSPSYGEGVTFWALSEMFRRRAGLAEGDDPETTRRAVAAMLQRHVPDEAERAWIEPRILVLLGVGEATPGGSAELFAAWRTFFERLSTTGTVALVIEDLQWSDDGLLDFLEHLLDWGRSSPIFVLTLARPELLDRRPGWGTDRRGATAMRLDPLPDSAMRELLDGVAPGLPAGMVTRILGRADGIPLYAVETIRMLAAKGLLVERGGRLEPAPGAAGAELARADLEVPPTLHALVASRLDALQPADRSLLQDAAVLGQSFTVEALTALSGESAGALLPRLTALVRREILTLETDPRAPTRGQHAFVQALLREVAFGTLSRRERRARHLAAARYFESLGDDEVAGVIATHFIEAYRAAPEGPEADALAAQARISLLATSERARDLGALRQAIDALGSALEVTRDPAQRADLLERMGYLQTLHSDWELAFANLAAAAEAYVALGDRRGVIRATVRRFAAHLGSARIAAAAEIAAQIRDEAEALVESSVHDEALVDRGAAEVAAIYAEGMARLEFRLTNMPETIRWSNQALLLAERLRDDEILAMAMVTKGTAATENGQLREGRALLEGAVMDATAHRQTFAALRGLNNLASETAEIDPRGALERTRQGIAMARRLGIRSFSGYHAGNAIGLAERLGEWAWLEEVIQTLSEGDRDEDEREWVRFNGDYLKAWRGDPDLALAERVLRRALAENDLQSEANIRMWLARCAFAAGNAREAVRHSEWFFRFAEGSQLHQEFGMVGRFALHAGDVEVATRVLAIVGIGSGGATEHDLELLRAGLAALEGRRDDALALYRAGLAGRRASGERFGTALAIFDMAVLLGPDDPAVRAVMDEGRGILEELGARLLLDRLDELETGKAGGGAKVRQADSAEMATGAQ